MQNETLMRDVATALSENRWHDVSSIAESLGGLSRRTTLRALRELAPDVVSSLQEVTNENGVHLNRLVLPAFEDWVKKKRLKLRIIQLAMPDILILSDLRGHLRFLKLKEISQNAVVSALSEITECLTLVPHGKAHSLLYQSRLNKNLDVVDSMHVPPEFKPVERNKRSLQGTHLWELEQESIYIIREAVAAAENPAMFFSLGKDSMVMLRLAQKAFAPEKVPFKLVNIDTRWKFQEMNTFREWIKQLEDFETIHYVNPQAEAQDINPFDHGSATHTDITKTQALRKILDHHKFDFVFGGARRDEEKSRAKERVFSVRDENHGWDPKNQRPELWDFYNTTLVNGQSMRVFPLSNWTEKDIWDYLDYENVPLVPLYFSATRPYVVRNGSLIMVDDERFRLADEEEIQFGKIRFRSLGCYPLSGGVESHATSVSDIATELGLTRISERSARVIDFDRGASMEQKKKGGYF